MANKGRFQKGVHYSPNTEFKKGRVALVGKDHPAWKGGRTIDARGYVLIKNIKHPNTKANGYVQEHRLVMENHLGRILKRLEQVHHINGDKTDNKIENLRVVTPKEHYWLHH